MDATPRPIKRQRLRSADDACDKRGYHANGTEMLRPSLRSTQSVSSQTATFSTKGISISVGMPQGTDRAGSILMKMGDGIEAARDRLREISEPQTNLVELIFGGVFERFSRLQIIFAEYNFCWVLPVLRKRWTA